MPEQIVNDVMIFPFVQTCGPAWASNLRTPGAKCAPSH